METHIIDGITVQIGHGANYVHMNVKLTPNGKARDIMVQVDTRKNGELAMWNITYITGFRNLVVAQPKNDNQRVIMQAIGDRAVQLVKAALAVKAAQRLEAVAETLADQEPPLRYTEIVKIYRAGQLVDESVTVQDVPGTREHFIAALEGNGMKALGTDGYVWERTVSRNVLDTKNYKRVQVFVPHHS